MSQPMTADSVRDILRRVVDPELGVNIVDLGLIYRIEIEGEQLLIDMTMTSPACPMGDMILDDLRSELDRAFADCSPDIKLVWEPPWDPAMMSPRSKAHFGWSAENPPPEEG